MLEVFNHAMQLFGQACLLFLASENCRFDKDKGLFHMFRPLLHVMSVVNVVLAVANLFNYFYIHIHWI